MKMSNFWPKSKAKTLVFWPKMTKMKLIDSVCRLKSDENGPCLTRKLGYSFSIWVKMTKFEFD